MTPYEIEVFLHHAASSAPFPRADAPIYPETVEGLIRSNLLARYGEAFRPTAFGMAFREMLCATPLPQILTVDPRTGDRIEV